MLMVEVSPAASGPGCVHSKSMFCGGRFAHVHGAVGPDTILPETIGPIWPPGNSGCARSMTLIGPGMGAAFVFLTVIVNAQLAFVHGAPGATALLIWSPFAAVAGPTPAGAGAPSGSM